MENNNEKKKTELLRRLEALRTDITQIKDIKRGLGIIHEELGPFTENLKEELKKHPIDTRVFLREQLNEAKTLNKSLIPKSNLTYDKLEDAYKDKLTKIVILPKYLRKPLAADTKVLQIISYINRAMAVAEIFLNRNLKSL